MLFFYTILCLGVLHTSKHAYTSIKDLREAKTELTNSFLNCCGIAFAL